MQGFSLQLPKYFVASLQDPDSLNRIDAPPILPIVRACL